MKNVSLYTSHICKELDREFFRIWWQSEQVSWQYQLLWAEFSAPPKSIDQSLTVNVTVFEDKTFKEVIEIKWVHKGGLVIQLDFP